MIIGGHKFGGHNTNFFKGGVASVEKQEVHSQ